MPVITLSAKDIKDYFSRLAETMQANKERLIEMDSIFGDGDLGLTMSKGFSTANMALQASEEADLGKLLFLAGKTMASSVPSTMGTLIANGWMQAGKTLKGKTEVDGADVYQLFDAFYRGIADLGGAKPGEKTILDGLTGSLAFLQGKPFELLSHREVAEKLRLVTDKDVAATADMLAKHGRAAIRGEASRGIIDPGAQVGRLIMDCFAELLESR